MPRTQLFRVEATKIHGHQKMTGRVRLVSFTPVAILVACTGLHREVLPPPSQQHLAALKRAIRIDSFAKYRNDCGTIEVPDDAFIPVEVTGRAPVEVAVTFGRVHCASSLNQFLGTGGVLVQIWSTAGGVSRLLLEKQLHGFTPLNDGLVTMQHGRFCPDGAGPDQCRIIYQWNDCRQQLEEIERRLASTIAAVEPMEFDYEVLARRGSR